MNLNFANLSKEVKLTDTLKYYQKRVAQLSLTTTTQQAIFPTEVIFKLMAKFRWKTPRKILDFKAVGKGVIPTRKL